MTVNILNFVAVKYKNRNQTNSNYLLTTIKAHMIFEEEDNFILALGQVVNIYSNFNRRRGFKHETRTAI